MGLLSSACYHTMAMVASIISPTAQLSSSPHNNCPITRLLATGGRADHEDVQDDHDEDVHDDHDEDVHDDHDEDVQDDHDEDVQRQHEGQQKCCTRRWDCDAKPFLATRMHLQTEFCQISFQL